MRGIADTGFLIAFANRRDQHHDWAVELAAQISAPLLTCDAVLAEAAFQLESSSLALAFVTEGLVASTLQVADHLPRLAQLATRFADRNPDLADLCLIRLSELHPRLPVITTDMRDFRVYRRNRNEPLPLLVPPHK